MPPHIRCILSTRCILTHSHSYAFKRIQMHSLTHAFTSVRRCIHSCMLTRVCIRWRLGWHMGALMARLMARPQPVQPISVHVSLALSPLRLLLCKYVCGPWCILVHSDAFLCIHVHSCAFLSIMKRVRSRPGAHRNRVFFLLSALEYIIMHLNASQIECSTFKMHQAENVLECVKMRHV